jgi:hypothetical protein
VFASVCINCMGIRNKDLGLYFFPVSSDYMTWAFYLLWLMLVYVLVNFYFEKKKQKNKLVLGSH